MKRRLWTSKQKSQIVLEGLSGQIDISALCQKYRTNRDIEQIGTHPIYFHCLYLFLAGPWDSFQNQFLIALRYS
jgi:hypothetical protein